MSYLRYSDPITSIFSIWSCILMLKLAQKLLETATYSNLSEIRECRADLIRERAKVEQDFSIQYQDYELRRPDRFIYRMDQKRKGLTKMTWTEIDRLSKLEALKDNNYIESKSLAKVYMEYMNQLKDLQISLMHAHKDQILHYKN